MEVACGSDYSLGVGMDSTLMQSSLSSCSNHTFTITCTRTRKNKQTELVDTSSNRSATPLPVRETPKRHFNSTRHTSSAGKKTAPLRDRASTSRVVATTPTGKRTSSDKSSHADAADADGRSGKQRKVAPPVHFMDRLEEIDKKCEKVLKPLIGTAGRHMKLQALYNKHCDHAQLPPDLSANLDRLKKLIDELNGIRIQTQTCKSGEVEALSIQCDNTTQALETLDSALKEPSAILQRLQTTSSQNARKTYHNVFLSEGQY